MFDWACGSLLKKFVEHKMYTASWEGDGAVWLKNWNNAWMFGLIDFTPRMRILDVGSGVPNMLRVLHRQFGCEVSALDIPNSSSAVPQFGFLPGHDASDREVTLYQGLVGDDVLPAESFDLISCISVVEHTYDTTFVMAPERPLAHVNILRDLVRMLKPGGALLMNWDLFLEGAPHFVGWDYEVDYGLLKHCGLSLLSPRRKVRSRQYIFNHPDTLFFSPAPIMDWGLPVGVPRGTSINMLWRKPGRMTRVNLQPHPALEAHYFPEGETTAAAGAPHDDDLTTADIERRFRDYMSHISRALGSKRYCVA